MTDLTLWGVVAIIALAVLGVVAAWLLLRDTTPKPPGRHERPRRTPQEPIHYDEDSPAQDWLSGDYQPPGNENGDEQTS